jgi:hypothetical protein
MITRIHVNGQNLRANKKRYTKKHPQGKRNTVFTVKDYKRNRKGNYIQIHGESEIIYQPNRPLKSGAVAWIETYADVDVFDDNGNMVTK